MNAGVLVVLRFPAPAFIAFGTSWQKVGSFLETQRIFIMSAGWVKRSIILLLATDQYIQDINGNMTLRVTATIIYMSLTHIW